MLLDITDEVMRGDSAMTVPRCSGSLSCSLHLQYGDLYTSKCLLDKLHRHVA